jgi:CRP-like cAMP-binding protein
VNSELIRFAPIFLGLTDNEREIVATSLTTAQCAANSALFKAGEQSEALYIIDHGFVRLTTNSGQALATLGPGSVLGETSLFRASVQDVSALAASELEFGKLTDRKLRELVLQNPMIGLKLSQNFGSLIAQMEDYLVQRLSRTTELGSLPHHTLQTIASYLESRTIRAQDTLYRLGEQPGGLFLVESGVFELRPEVNLLEQESQRVQNGGLLGALALLTNKPYTNTAVAVEDSLLWVLSPESFQTVNSRHPGLRRSLGRYVRARLGRTDQAQAAKRLTQMPIFAEVPPNSMQAIAQRMVLQHVPAGERVYRVGEAGDALYLIESGEIELTEENASGIVEEKARISAGGFFGEMGLLTGRIRTEDATATRNTNLWVLAKSDLDELTVHHPAIGHALSQGIASRLSDGDAGNEEAFRKFALLSDLGATELRQVVAYLRPTRYRTGEQIYRVNSPADTLYLLEKGQVRVQPLSGASLSFGAGEAFGERALLTNQPHNTTVIAESDVDVWMLSKQDFEMLMNRYPALAISLSRMLSQRMLQTPVTDLAPVEPVLAPPPPQAGTRRRQTATPTPVNAPLPRRMAETPEEPRVGFGQWYANLTLWGKLRLVLLILLVLWLIGIAAPSALWMLLDGTSNAGSTVAQALANVYKLGSYEVAAADAETAKTIALIDSQAPPTPTYTPVPTETSVVTPTPLPTDEPTPLPTTQSVFIPAQPPQQVVQNAAPPPPAPEEVARSANVRARAWDGRLDQLGVTVEEASVAPGQPYWRVVEARWADEVESGGKHHIYVEVLDENGSRVVGQPVTVWWGDGNHSGPTEDKAPPDFGWNFQMYAAGYAYSAKVEGLPSDVVKGAGMGSMEDRFKGIHTSYYFVFQKATK